MFSPYKPNNTISFRLSARNTVADPGAVQTMLEFLFFINGIILNYKNSAPGVVFFSLKIYQYDLYVIGKKENEKKTHTQNQRNRAHTVLRNIFQITKQRDIIIDILFCSR